MKVKQFRYSADNLGYLIYGEESAIAVDGGAFEQMLSFIEEHCLELRIVTNTHSHGDHTCGNRELAEATEAEFINVGELPSRRTLPLEGSRIDIIHTPGHTADSVCFYIPGILVSGDTLFNGKVGRCFTGDIRTFYKSIRKLLELPGDTVIYGGHDYVREYLEFARMVEPSNSFINAYLRRYDPTHVFASLEEELKVDPFLRLNEPSVTSFLKSRNLPVSTEYQRWESLMSLM
ncbi:MAG: MBL fold metallo-hydrolase [Candidatus Aegiribacteria sp.]|nr:MBL fold metallo-hydrolase [Candidatus Aegiribacteria sp.]